MAAIGILLALGLETASAERMYGGDAPDAQMLHARQVPTARFPGWRPSPSRSVGLPWNGHLEGGVWLAPSATLRHVPRFATTQNFYGTEELVGLLRRTAAAIAARWPMSRLGVGELSARRGGYLRGHHSHRNGRDVDVAFFLRNARGAMGRAFAFVPFEDPAGFDAELGRYRFDDERNWALVATMLRDPQARVQYMFVSKPLRARLLKAGRRAGVGQAFLRAAAAVLSEPLEGHKHADHFHVRIFCARDDRSRCRDSLPYWPWYEGTPPGGTYSRLPRLHWRTRTEAQGSHGPQ